MKILVTGATGFVGGHVVRYLLEHTNANLMLVIRKQASFVVEKLYAGRAEIIRIDDLLSDPPWDELLKACHAVIHIAACTKVANHLSPVDELQVFRKINVDATLHLAKQAAQAQVKRFIYISSIKVNGESTRLGAPFKSEDNPKPQSAYGVSKFEAEVGLKALATQSDLEIVIIRPPMVYGLGVKGNFQRMVSFLSKRRPVPVKSLTRNKRSLISVDNLASLITTCLTHPNASGQVFLASDGDDLSTAELCLQLQGMLGSSAILLPCPAWILNCVALLLRKRLEVTRLTGSLQVDISKARMLLDWSPIEKVEDALRKTLAGC